MHKKFLFHLFFTLLSVPIWSQTNTYILNGSARQDNCNCYTLTNAANTQSGSVWNASKIDLNTSFDFIFNVNLGSKDADGADGIVFILQPISTSVGTVGEGMGFQGIIPSVGIALDTWQNFNLSDPAFDHISIQANGNSHHNSDLAGPIQASSANANIEDGQWHTLRISWDAAGKWLRAYFDGELRVEKQQDLIATIFNNDPMVYWGFSAGTGGSNNLQQFCTALNPGFSTDLPGNKSCQLQPVNFTNTSASFAPIKSYYWDFGDGATATVQNPPTHTYDKIGVYTVKQVITGFDGCVSDTLREKIVIADPPVAKFQIFDTCAGFNPRVTEASTVQIGNISQWNWQVNGTDFSSGKDPGFGALPAGDYVISLTAISEYGCSSSAASDNLLMKPTPRLSAEDVEACINIPIELTAVQEDNTTNIIAWEWTSGHGMSATDASPDFLYEEAGHVDATVTATADNGCVSETLVIPVMVYEAKANAGNDTVVIKDEPFQLHASGGETYQWSPSTGLNDPAIANPTGILQDDITYLLSVVTAQGCLGEDSIKITVFKGSAVFVPTGFTPNNDGLNEQLIPYYKGIKTLDYFMVYNRWGQLIFTARDANKGWDGKINGVVQPVGIYIWKLKATDYIGKQYDLKGTTTLIR